MSSREKPRAVCVRSLVPKEKNSARAGDLAGREARARQLDHRAHLEVAVGLEALLRGDAQDEVARDLELAGVRHERDHDLDLRRAPGALPHRARGAEDRARLHLVDLGMDEPEPDAARAEHRVALRERPHALERVLDRGGLGSVAQPRLGDLLDELHAIGHELVQRRVEQPDRDRQPLHRLEDPFEVALLEREQLVERRAAAGLVVGHDHALHLALAIGGHEHVLGPAQPDALGTEGPRAARVLGRVGVGAHAERAQLVAPRQHRLEALVDRRRHQRDVVERDGAGRPVDGDEVALVEDVPVHAHLAGVQVDVQRRRRR